METRICPKCDESKPIEKFSLVTPKYGTRRTTCTACYSAESRRRRKERERIKAGIHTISELMMRWGR